jgi:glycosyltransferase involved in cell wall biosynthesis
MLHIVIATRGRAGLLERTLRSLEKCEPVSVYGQALVIENGERSGAEDVVRRAAAPLRARYLFHPEANKSSALNAALHQLEDGLVVFLDDDVLVGEGLLRAYAAAASGVTQGVFFGGPVHADYELQPAPWLMPYLPVGAKGWSLDPTTTVITSPDFLGANWAAFARDLKEFGGFDPWFGPGSATRSTGQEQAMQIRLLGAGLHGRYVPDAEVWHWNPQDRCSPRWALHRAYRNGVKYGLQARLPADIVRVWGYPRYAVRSAAEKTLWAIVRSVDPRPEARFKARHEWLVALGFLKGNRLAHLRSRSS